MPAADELPTQSLLVVAAVLQGIAVAYCVVLLRKHRAAASAWLCLLCVLLSMFVWRVAVTTGLAPGPAFNTGIAIWGSVFAVAAMFLFGREVARRQRAEAERDHLLDSERTARSEAERANRIKDEFLATLSHELRTPLAAILGWCAILHRQRGDPAHVDRAVTTIERNARIQARLVDDLLDATRMQAGSLHLELAPVALEAPVCAAIEAVRPAAEEKQIRIELRCEQPPPTVVGDASRLQQIASNLLVNAVKFSPPGAAVQVAIGTSAGKAELTVADTGAGIDPAFMPVLFQRFRQADSGSTRQYGGLGLGLSIVASLVALHGGEVTAASEGPGRGATFTVRLPLAARTAAASGERADRAAARAAPALPSLEGCRVLLVDDEPDVRSAVSTLLEQNGAVVRALDSGATIETALLEFRPQVLLLDIGMPGEDGYSLLRRVRRLPAASGGRTPAISLTAHARDEDREHAFASGFQAHLPKPVDFPALAAAIREQATASAAAAHG